MEEQEKISLAQENEQLKGWINVLFRDPAQPLREDLVYRGVQ